MVERCLPSPVGRNGSVPIEAAVGPLSGAGQVVGHALAVGDPGGGAGAAVLKGGAAALVAALVDGKSAVLGVGWVEGDLAGVDGGSDLGSALDRGGGGEEGGEDGLELHFG